MGRVDHIHSKEIRQRRNVKSIGDYVGKWKNDILDIQNVLDILTKVARHTSQQGGGDFKKDSGIDGGNR